jgi:hypothetical protein
MQGNTIITNHKIQGSISENKNFLYGFLASTDVTATA